MNCDPLYDRYSSLNAGDRAGFDLKELLNLYRYCLNNPVTYIDSKGMNSEEPQKKQLPEKKQEPVEKKKKEPVSNLVVEGDEAYKKAVIEALQLLEPTAKIDMDTGEITVGKKASKGHASGHELLKRIITNEKGHRVTISQEYSEKAGRNFAEPRSRLDAGDPQKGSGSIVGWRKSDDVSFPVPVISDAGATIFQKSIPHISLGHELIHAEHAIRGIWRDNKDNKDLATYQGLDKRRYRAAREELRTIGMEGFYDKETDITENMLRDESDLPLRARY